MYKSSSRLQKAIPILLVGLFASMALFFPYIDKGADLNNPLDSGDTAWMLTASALVLLMTPGLAFFYGGMVRYKNLVSTLLQSFIALGLISIIWVLVGFSLVFGDSIGGFLGSPETFLFFQNVGISTDSLLAPTIPLALFAMFQLKFAIITPALITGGLAERIRFSALLLFIILFSIFIYAPLAHWTWHPEGFLRVWGVLDFAGGTVVHISAGLAALAGAIFLGKRKTNNEEIKPTNVPYVVLGTGLLWFGWFGFNAGSALAADELAVSAFMNTNIASAVAMTTWLFIDYFRNNRYSAVGACIGAVVGLVAITPAAGFVNIGQSIFIGFAASVISNLVISFKHKTNIDDTLDVFACHGVGGIVGMILTGVFAKDVGLIYGQTETFSNHLLALVIVIPFTFLGSYILFKITNWIIPMRVDEEAEKLGLDLTQHGETATA